MTTKSEMCSSHNYRRAVTTLPFTHRISATETQTSQIPACEECRDAYLEEQAQQTKGTVRIAQAIAQDARDILYTPAWHTARIDRFASEIRQVVADWFERDEDDEQNTRRLRGRMLLLARNLSAEMGDLDFAVNHPHSTGIRGWSKADEAMASGNHICEHNF